MLPETSQVDAVQILCSRGEKAGNDAQAAGESADQKNARLPHNQGEVALCYWHPQRILRPPKANFSLISLCKIKFSFGLFLRVKMVRSLKPFCHVAFDNKNIKLSSVSSEKDKYCLNLSVKYFRILIDCQTFLAC